MPRKRRQKSRPTSGHFTSVELHQLRRKVMRVNRITAKPVIGELLRLGRHLCEQCEICWTSAEAISPPFKPCLGEPVTDALARLANPSGWLTLTVEHWQALRHARSRPYGFSYVVFEESLAQNLAKAMSRGSTKPPTQDFRFWADHLLEEIAMTAGVTPELADATVYAACNEIEIHLMAGRIPEAEECVDGVHELLESSTGQPFLRARALELEGHVHEMMGRFPNADQCYEKALDALGPDQARRRFEIRVESVELLFRRRVSPEQIYMAFAGALAELSTDQGGPLERLYVAHDMARSTRSLGKMAREAGMRQWPGIPEALAALERVWPLYREHTDRSVIEMAEGYRSDLEELVDDLDPMPAN